MADNTEFVTIELNKNRVMTDNLKKDKNGKQYATIFAPDGGTYLYLVDKIKVRDDKPDIYYFSLPKGSEIQVSYPNDVNGQREYVTRSIAIEDLKEAYIAEKAAYAENNGYVSMTVPTEWGNDFTSKDGVKLVSISIPVPYENNKAYMAFVVKKDYFRESTKAEGMSYFSFPKKKTDAAGKTEEDFTVKLKGQLKVGDNEYKDIEKIVTSKELGELVKNAVKSSNYKETFVSTVISNKLARAFKSKNGQDLYDISVPITNENDSKDVAWFHVVVPSERVKELEDEKISLNLFRKGTNGEDYTFKASSSVKNQDNSYSDYSTVLTSIEIIEAFENSKAQYASESHSHSLADELSGNTTSEDSQINNQRRVHGR